MMRRSFIIIAVIIALFGLAACVAKPADSPVPDTDLPIQTGKSAEDASASPSVIAPAATPAGPDAELTPSPGPQSRAAGLIVVGDSRCCQLLSLQQQTGRNDFAVFATWGGHYIGGRKPAILTDAALAGIEETFRSQVEAYGECVIWFFATVNDYNYTRLDNSEGVSAALRAAEGLAAMTYEAGGRTFHPRVIVVGFDGCRDSGKMNGIPHEDFNRYIAAYNAVLRSAVERSALLRENARFFTTVPDIVGGKAGFIDDGLHYDDATLEAIIAYITDGGNR